MVMSIWPKNPSLYEINTWVWLTELGLKTGARIDLGSVPASEWDAIARFGFDAVWLMGVWERSPAGIANIRSVFHPVSVVAPLNAVCRRPGAPV